MKSFTLFTMKSKHVWMKSKPCGFDEIKSVLISAEGDFICEADFIHDSGFIPSQDGFSWKKHQSCIKIGAFFWIWWSDLNRRSIDYDSHTTSLKPLIYKGFKAFLFVATLPFVAHLFAPNLLLFDKNYVTCHRAFSLPKIVSKIIVKVNDQCVKIGSLTFLL